MAARARLNPDGAEETNKDSEIELHGNYFERYERAENFRPGGRRRLDNFFDLITRMNNIQVHFSALLRMPHERAGPSHSNINAPSTKSRSIVYSSDEEARRRQCSRRPTPPPRRISQMRTRFQWLSCVVDESSDTELTRLSRLNRALMERRALTNTTLRLIPL